MTTPRMITVELPEDIALALIDLSSIAIDSIKEEIAHERIKADVAASEIELLGNGIEQLLVAVRNKDEV